MLACIYLSYIFSIVCGVNIYIYGPGLQAAPPTPPQRVWVHRFLYVGGTSGLPPPPLWVGGACLYVHACIGVGMYLSVSMYVCMYSLCVCMYTCNACCEASTQTNLLLLSLLLGGPNPFGGGGGHEPGTRDHIYLGLYCCPHNSLSSTSLKFFEE